MRNFCLRRGEGDGGGLPEGRYLHRQKLIIQLSFRTHVRGSVPAAKMTISAVPLFKVLVTFDLSARYPNLRSREKHHTLVRALFELPVV